MQKMAQTGHSVKMMWGCVAFAILAVILVTRGVGAGALFIIPCMLMMGAMMWMIMGSGSKPRGGDKT
ncbi:MAG: hypothetical protein ABJC62_06380 [Frankiaceae bacterium]